MRNAYLSTLYELAKQDSNVLSLVADNGTIVYDEFIRDFPDQYFNFGISENNMIAAAAGMASCGKIPFAYTISAFLAYRSFEFIRDDVCFQNQNVKIVGIGSGVSYSTLGPSHHTTEDIGVLRVLPNLTLFSPGSPMDVRNIMQASYELVGPVYIRLGTNNEEEIYTEPCHFQIGRGATIKDGKDITIVGTGSIVADALKAAKQLENRGVSIRVLNMHTLKPFDSEIILKAAEETGKIVTIEEHSIIGGLGSLVAEVLADNSLSVQFKRIGLNDCFAHGYGTPREVKEMNGLGVDCLVDSIIQYLNGK